MDKQFDGCRIDWHKDGAMFTLARRNTLHFLGQL